MCRWFRDTYIAGAKVLRQYGLGPLPGVAMMVVLVSRGGFATITARYDRAAIAHEDLFAECLRRGFDEVLALAGDPPPRVVPSSFPDVKDDPRNPGTDRCPTHEREQRQPGRSREMRLPGSVAEVMASPPGPRIGAFFDLDGTLVAGFTAVIPTRERFRSRDMGIGELITMIAAGLDHKLGRLEFESLITKASERLLRPRAQRHPGDRGAAVRPEDREADLSRDAGTGARPWNAATPWSSSSALTIQVDPVAKFLGIENTLTNRFEVDEDDAHRQGDRRSCGAGQGQCGTEVRRRERHRPAGQLLLRRR